jgi:spore coat protein CotH
MNPPRRHRQLVWAVAATALALGTFVRAQSPALPSDALFNSDDVQRVDLRVHSADWEKLKQNFQENTYYPADLVFNGQTVRNVGIRSRGLGSRSATKPGLRVDFDRYATDQTFLGLKSFVLDNLTQDPSTVKETVTMKLFARLGIPAPREAHVRLYVNDEYAGLYANVESIDKRFLARIFGLVAEDTQNDGYLFEFNYVDPWRFSYLGSDLEAYKLRFDPKTRESRSDQEKFGPIEELVRLANELPSDQFLSTLNERIDLRAFMRYVAGQSFVAQNDGFLGYDGMNNFYLYRLEGSSQHVFLAWDEDNAFWESNFSVTTRQDENVLMRKAMEVPELRDAFYQALVEAAASADEPTGPEQLPWLEYEMRREMDLIAQAIRDDQNKPYSVVDHESARALMLEFARARPRAVREQMEATTARRK